MSILKYRASKYTSFTAFLAAAFVVLAVLLSAGCNQDGVGIYYSISQEEKQINSKISELPVHQVVEANGNVYALTGRTIWEQPSGSSSWNDIGGGYAYSMVSYGGTLYAYFNYDDNDLDEGEIKSWGGSSWSPVYSINADADFFDIDGAYALEVGGGGTTTEVQVTETPSSAPYPEETGISEDVFDGTSLLPGPTYYLISSTTCYSGALGSISTSTPNFNGQAKSGDFVSIANDGTDTYLITSSGQIYYGNATDYYYIATISDDNPVQGSSDVVDIGGTNYLIIGTENGYYEVNLTTDTLSGPDQTADTSDPDNFDANYPELAQALVYDVYASSLESDVFYLATQNGLWKRTSTGEFKRQ